MKYVCTLQKTRTVEADSYKEATDKFLAMFKATEDGVFADFEIMIEEKD